MIQLHVREEMNKNQKESIGLLLIAFWKELIGLMLLFVLLFWFVGGFESGSRLTALPYLLGILAVGFSAWWISRKLRK